MVTAAAVALGLLALALGALAVPVDLEVARPGGGLPTSVRVGWLGGRVAWEPVPGTEQPAEADEEEPAPPEAGEEEEPSGRRGPGVRRALAALRTPGLAPAAGRTLARLGAAVRLRRATATVRLPDPADTGRLWGLVGPGAAALPADWRTRLDLRPDFSPGEPEVTGRLTARLVPLRLVASVVAFVLSPAVLRAGWRAARAG